MKKPRKWIGICAAILFAGLVATASTELSEQREWESIDGRKITASVIEFNAESKTVKMKRQDGLVFTVEIDKFAKDDVRLLEEALKKEAETTAKSQSGPEATEESAEVEEELPERFECDDVPMVRQKGNYCVPASATMIAGFHGIETDQDQIAFLSSAGSFNNQGTNPQDMVLAMQKLGFDGRPLYWQDKEDFMQNVLPAIKRALVRLGPIYISFAPGVFGDSGHGCVIVGYHDRREYLMFYNPWGNTFEKDYEDVATQARGIVIIDPPKPAPIASGEFIEKMQTVVPKFEGGFMRLASILKRKGQKHELVWCSRRDARDDKRFAVDTARDDGRKILDLAFHRNPAVLIPASEKSGETKKYLFVTRPPEGGARFLVREITEEGWSEPELFTLGSLTRAWPTQIMAGSSGEIIWELPMIELHPED
ncbi:MAG: C39 family peptidase [Opitutales bacterium]